MKSAVAFIFYVLTWASTSHATLVTYIGCFNSTEGFTDMSQNTFQSLPMCQRQCINAERRVAALTGGKTCLCGDQIPTESVKVDEEECNAPCPGFIWDMCGGDDAFSVFTHEEPKPSWLEASADDDETGPKLDAEQTPVASLEDIKGTEQLDAEPGEL